MNAEDLRAKKCTPCEGGVPSWDRGQAETALEVLPDWILDDDAGSIRRQYRMKNFEAAVALIQAICLVAEDEDHHPDLHLTGYRNLEIVLSTHAIQGLSENDFIVAAKIDVLPKALKQDR